VASAPAGAAVIKDLGPNPSSATGQFSNAVPGTAAFSDQYTFSLSGAPLFVTFASATNDFARTSDFITSFTGQLFQVVGGVNVPVSAVATPQPCQTNPAGCQVVAGSAILAAGNYFLQIAGIGGGTSGYGGNLTTSAVPIPGALALFATGLVGLGLLKRKKKNTTADVA